MALTRSGAPAPTSSVSNAQASANRSIQNANRAGSLWRSPVPMVSTSP